MKDKVLINKKTIWETSEFILFILVAILFFNKTGRVIYEIVIVSDPGTYPAFVAYPAFVVLATATLFAIYLGCTYMIVLVFTRIIWANTVAKKWLEGVELVEGDTERKRFLDDKAKLRAKYEKTLKQRDADIKRLEQKYDGKYLVEVN